uniref:Uncharacterized protein n=1 Tax=Parascaris univalens TaxID=6257 RepID=A0A914ZI33_PARUN
YLFVACLSNRFYIEQLARIILQSTKYNNSNRITFTFNHRQYIFNT